MKKRSGFQVMMSLIGLVKPLTGFMIIAIVMGVIGNLCASFITILGGMAIANVMGLYTNLSLKIIFISLLLFALLRGILRYAEQACNHFIAFKLLALIRSKVFMALRKLCPAKLEGKDKGDLISIITSDIELLEVFYAHTISPIAIACIFSAIMCFFIGSFAPLLGVIALIAYIVVGLIIPLVTSRLNRDKGLRFRSQSGQLSAFVLDSLRGLSEIIQYNQGQNRLASMNEQTASLAKEEEKMKKIAGRNQAVTNTVILFFDLLMLLVAAVFYQNGQVDFAGLLIPVISLMSSFGPLVALANLGSTLTNTFAAGNRVLNILEESPVVEEITGKENITFTGASAENVSFSYNDEVILDNISLDITPGTTIGIVGKSGSGKSTFLKLLMRFWDVNNGKISLSGTDIREINTSNLRHMESFMTQETQLFHDSIKNNLRIAKLDTTDDEIMEACRKASIHDFIISLPNGYDTTVAELGDSLSGGERQRLGLARAFLHNSDLLLLDEPTSNLDSLNEAVILKSLKDAKENRTLVLVSHRLSTMCIADKVYSVEGGRMS